MPAQTTLKAAAEQFVALLQEALVAQPPTAAAPFRRVITGEAGVVQGARPALAVWLAKSRPIAASDGDKVLLVSLAMRIVVDVTAASPHDALLDAVAAVEDYLDSLIGIGVLDGADGFDDREWSFAYPEAPAAPRVASAKGTQSFTVRVQRGHNRVPPE